MFVVLKPLIDRRTYTGAVFAALAAAVLVPAGMVAVIALLPHWPRGARTAVFAVALLALIATAGLPVWARRGCVWLANRLLNPRPSLVAGTVRVSRWHSRLRTSLWLVTCVVTAAVVVLVSGLLVAAAAALPAIWLNGGEAITVAGADVTVSGDGRGGWTLVVAAALVLLAVYLVAGAAAVWRWSATRLLGPDAAERLAAAEARARDLARRNRLARELHDSIGHTLTTSTIQAAVANQLMDSDPASARRALTTIEESTRLALDDLDYVLGVLRHDAATREPARTLADLGPLLDRVEASGASVRRELGEGLGAVPSVVAREAYRVVQEAVTNALRHAPGETVDVAVSASGGMLSVAVANRLPSSAGAAVPDRAPSGSAGQSRAPSDVAGQSRTPSGSAGPDRSLSPAAEANSGRGLAGAAERVRLLGGEFAAGPGDDATSWVLRARLPLRR